MGKAQKFIFLAIYCLVFILCLLSTSHAHSHFCICYQERVKGKVTTVTTCRQKREQCIKLSEKVLYTGSPAIVKGSLSHACTQVYKKDKLGTESGWKPSTIKGGSWYTGGCLLKQNSNFLARLKHIYEGYGDIPSLIRIDKEDYTQGEPWTVLTKEGAKAAVVVGSGTGGDWMNGEWFGVELSIKKYLMALPSVQLKAPIKYQSITAFDPENRLNPKDHVHLYTTVRKHVLIHNQSQKLKNLSLDIFPYRMTPSYEYLIYLKFHYPNEQDPRISTKHQLYAYNANDKHLVALSESNWHFSIDWVSDLDLDHNYEIYTSEGAIESPIIYELIYMDSTMVYRNSSE